MLDLSCVKYFIANAEDDDVHELVTPFLGAYRDNIVLYVTRVDDDFVICDDGALSRFLGHYMPLSAELMQYIMTEEFFTSTENYVHSFPKNISTEALECLFAELLQSLIHIYCLVNYHTKGNNEVHISEHQFLQSQLAQLKPLLEKYKGHPLMYPSLKERYDSFQQQLNELHEKS